MAGKSSQSNNRGSDLFGYFVSGKHKEYHTNQFASTLQPTGLTATGGVINDYASGSNVYRSHTFTTSGAFEVTALGDFDSTVDIILVGGGGAGGSGDNGSRWSGGGGGAGGFINLPGHTISETSYPIVIGGGGNCGAIGPNGTRSTPGTDTVGFSSTAYGGGGGGTRAIDNTPQQPGGAGASGGGGSGQNYGNSGIIAKGSTNQPTQGNPGGDGHYVGGGGGGAGGAGGESGPPNFTKNGAAGGAEL